ncbi:MAG: GerAB/ArcD/ProY family transporter [Clostridia bacterium]
MKNSLTSRQAALMCSVMILASKLLVLPSLLYTSNQTSAIFSATIIFALEFIFLIFLLKIKKKHPKKSFFNFFENKIGKLLTKIILLLLFLFFVLKICYVMQESFYFFKRSLYTSIPISLFLICVLPIISAFAYRGLKPLGRTLEIFFWLILGLLIFSTIAWAISVSDFSLTITASNGWDGFLNATFGHTFWFGDLVFMMFILDKVELEEKSQKQILLYAGLTMLWVLGFFVVYFVAFQTTAFTHPFAILNIIQFVSDFGTVGKFDILPITAVMFVMFFQLGIYLICAVGCIQKVIPFKHKAQTLIAINALLILISYIIFNNANSVVVFYGDFLMWFSIAVVYGISIIYLLVTWRTKRGEK